MRWVFLGQGVLGAAALEALLTTVTPAAVLTMPWPGGVSPITTLARARGVPVRTLERLGEEPDRRWPELAGPVDAGVVGCWPERLTDSALAVPRHGWLNLHPSALPAWRGADPVGWQLLTGARRLGLTVHRMVARQDAGPIVARDAVALDEGDDRAEAERRAGAALGALAGQVLARLASDDELGGEPQDEDAASWCPPVGTAVLLETRAMRAGAAARVVRAFSPQPGVAVAGLPTDQRVCEPAVGERLDAGTSPGEHRPLDARRVALACQDRWLAVRLLTPGPPPAVTELTPPGATRLPRG